MTGRLFTAGVIERVRLPLRAHKTTNEATNHGRSFVPSTRGSQITVPARTHPPARRGLTLMDGVLHYNPGFLIKREAQISVSNLRPK